MTLTIHEKIEQRSEEWYEQRRGIVTASVVGQLITTRKLSAIDYPCPECEAPAQNPCRGKKGQEITTKHTARADEARRGNTTPILEVASNDDSRRLTEKLVAERITGQIHQTFVNDDMYRGIVCEPIARDYYAKYRETTVEEVGFMLLERDGVKLGYSPDGLVGEQGLCEIKCPRQHTHMRTVISGTVPAEYMAQLQCGLLVSGREWIDFVSFVGGMKLYVKRVFPDPRWQKVIIDAARQFESVAPELQRAYDEESAGLPMTDVVPDQLDDEIAV